MATQVLHTATTNTIKQGQFLEVWGDTVDSVHLAWAIVIGCVISLSAFLLASRALMAIVESPEMARAYAMLVGLAGCLISGVVCAKLFPPKREVVEDTADEFWREEVLTQLLAETGSLGSMSDLPPATVQELKELGLYELFAAHDRMSAEEVPSAEDVLRRELLQTRPSEKIQGHQRGEEARL
jgi:DUF917 family protein